jgi:hypothetical protein
VFALAAKLAVVATVAAPGFSKEISDSDGARWARAGGMGYLIRAAWTEGEAVERGLIPAPSGPVGRGMEPEYEGWIELLDAELKQPILQAAALSVTPAQIDAYVQAHPLKSPGERRVRMITARNGARAKAIEQALRRGVTWKVAARRYAPGAGARLTTFTGPPRTALGRAVERARLKTLTRHKGTVFEVVRDTPPAPLPLGQQRATAWEILAGDAQSRAIAEYEAAINAKWRPRTTCADPNQAQRLCGNSPTG